MNVCAVQGGHLYIKVRLCRIEDDDGLAVVALPVEELEGQMWNSSG